MTLIIYNIDNNVGVSLKASFLQIRRRQLGNCFIGNKHIIVTAAQSIREEREISLINFVSSEYQGNHLYRNGIEF